VKKELEVVVEPTKEDDAGQILSRSSEDSKSDEKSIEKIAIDLKVDFKLLPEKVASEEEKIIRMDEDQSTPPLKKRGSSESKTSSPVTFRESGSFAKINLISSNAQQVLTTPRKRNENETPERQPANRTPSEGEDYYSLFETPKRCSKRQLAR
jgi:hypothetical protein